MKINKEETKQKYKKRYWLSITSGSLINRFLRLAAKRWRCEQDVMTNGVFPDKHKSDCIKYWT